MWYLLVGMEFVVMIWLESRGPCCYLWWNKALTVTLFWSQPEQLLLDNFWPWNLGRNKSQLYLIGNKTTLFHQMRNKTPFFILERTKYKFSFSLRIKLHLSLSWGTLNIETLTQERFSHWCFILGMFLLRFFVPGPIPLGFLFWEQCSYRDILGKLSVQCFSWNSMGKISGLLSEIIFFTFESKFDMSHYFPVSPW